MHPHNDARIPAPLTRPFAAGTKTTISRLVFKKTKGSEAGPVALGIIKELFGIGFHNFLKLIMAWMAVDSRG
jgi:hypothetical protein